MRQIIAMSLVIMALAACQSSDEATDSGIQYYRKIKFSETPFDMYEGLHPITAKESRDVNHYRFTYDDMGRLVELQYARGEELLDGSSTGSPRISISYEDNMEIHHFYNRQGEPRSYAGYFRAEYELDPEGVRKHLSFYDRQGNPVENRNGIARYDWERLITGQVKENRYNMEGEETVMNEFCPFYELRFDYDQDGFVTRMANYQGDTMYSCTVENCGDIGVSYFRFDYNDAGDITHFTVENLNGQLSNLYWGWARFENTYDEQGNLIERVMYDQDDEPLGGMSVPVTQMVYDDHGSVVERKYMDIDRQLINNPQTGVSIEKYIYDELGHPVDTLRFDAGMVAVL
jgi:YD repeat-containing protein